MTDGTSPTPHEGSTWADMERLPEDLWQEAVKRVLNGNVIFPKRRMPGVLDIEADAEALRTEAFIDADLLGQWVGRAVHAGKPLHHVYLDIASQLLNSGHAVWARSYYERFLRIANDADAEIMLLQCWFLADDASNEAISQVYRAWAERHGDSRHQGRRHANIPDPDRRIRIGYICQYIGRTLGRNMMVPMLRRHDPRRFEVFVYTDGEMAEDVADCARHWRSTEALDDDALARLIEADGIDIVLETNGFCMGHRLGVLMRRPAPVQIAWGNHSATSGMRSADYTLADHFTVPETEDPFYTETVYRGPAYMGGMMPQWRSPRPVAPPPSLSRGFVTFGYFGGAHKINPATVALWARVLRAVPQSRFLLKAGSLGHPQARATFLKMFHDNEIGEERLVLEGHSPYDEMLERYDHVDIMLDSMPINGGSTLMDAAWNGVPGLSILGERWGARNGPVYLKEIGVPELIAVSADDFVDRAVALAGGADRLRYYRNALRERVSRARVSDADAVMRDFETAYLDMWRRWCDRSYGAPARSA